MAEPSPAPRSPEVPPTPPKRPWWVKVFIVVAVLAALFVILSLAGVLPGGPGRHGPGRHVPGGSVPAGQTSPTQLHSPPPGFDHGS